MLPFDLPLDYVVLAAVGSVLALLVLRRLGSWLLGPIFASEVARLARNGRTNLIRILYALALFAALYAEIPGAEVTKDSAPEFAKQFATLFLVIQSAAVLLITPLYFGGAVSDEKEKHSLDFLLGTRLTAREIVLGKFGARLVNLIGILLVGLPVLALTMFWGGVDLKLVVVMFASAVVSAFSLGALSVLLSVLMRRSIQALVCSFAAMLAGMLCCSGPLISPIGLQQSIEARSPANILGSSSPVELLRDFSIVHGSAGLLFLGLAVWQLRLRAQPAGPPPAWWNAPPNNPLAYPESPASRDYQITMISFRPIRGDALLWRERNLGYFGDPYFDTFWIYFAGFLFLMALASWAISDNDVVKLIAKVFRWSTGLTAAGLCLVLLLRLAGSITRERDHRTLESILSLPVTRLRILYVKWLGAVLRSNRWIGTLTVGFGLGAVSGTFRPLEAALLLVLCLSWAAFVSSLTLLVGVFVRSTARAYVVSIIGVVAVLAATFSFAQVNATSDFSLASFPRLLRDASSPLHAWQMAGKPIDKVAAALVLAAAAYWAAALAMAACALWRFRREERYT